MLFYYFSTRRTGRIAIEIVEKITQIYENENNVTTQIQTEEQKSISKLSSYLSFRDFAIFVFKNLLDPFLKSIHECDRSSLRYFGIFDDSDEEQKQNIEESNQLMEDVIVDYTNGIKDKRYVYIVLIIYQIFSALFFIIICFTINIPKTLIFNRYEWVIRTMWEPVYTSGNFDSIMSLIALII